MTNLLDIIEAHIEAAGIAPSEFGRLAMNDPNFVADLRGGRDYRRSTEAKVLDFIRAHPPKKQSEAANT